MQHNTCDYSSFHIDLVCKVNCAAKSIFKFLTTPVGIQRAQSVASQLLASPCGTYFVVTTLRASCMRN